MDTPHRAPNSILVATAAAALHVVDDNVVQPDWGGIGDHLASTLVPLAVLAALVYALPRVRAGTRAAITLALGVLGLMFASEAIYDVSAGTLSGDDWTGLLSLVGGVWSVGLGAFDLWQHRRREGSRGRMVLRRSLRTAGALLAVMLVAYPLVETYAVTNAADRTVPAPQLGAPHQDVTFRTSDGLDLTGWYVPSRNGATIIVFPGRGRPQKHARMLIEHGYGVLLFDKRGTGTSDGEPNGYGWDGQRDIHAAVEFLQARPEVDDERIGGIGLSVGGELMLQAAAESDGLRAVVSDGAGVRSIRELDGVDSVEHIMAIPIFGVTTLAATIFTNGTPPPSLHDIAAKVVVPTLFIYAKVGQGGELLSKDYYRLAAGPKELWEIDAPHIGGIDAQPDEYERRVVAFLDGALLA